MNEIPLVAYLSDSVPDGSFEVSVNTEDGAVVAVENNRLTAEHIFCFYWVCRLSLLWKSVYRENKVVKWSRIFGQCSFLLMAVFYIYYINHCPFLKKPRFAFSLGNPQILTRIYFSAQGIRYLTLYILGIWLSFNPHIHHVLRKCHCQIVTLDGDWNRISQYITKRAILSIVVIVLPVFTIIPSVSHAEQCYENLDRETGGIPIKTIVIEVLGYMLFCFISLPVFLTMLFIAKVHMAELKKFSRQILVWRIDENGDPAEAFRAIQGAIQHSSEKLQWVLSIYYITMLIWMNACALLVLNKWIEEHDKESCWFPQTETRYTIVLVTQIVLFYIYPLYYFSKFPSVLKRLVVDVSTIDYRSQNRNGYFINTAELRQQMTTMIKTGLEHSPRFIVFWCLPISTFSTVLLICVTPVLPLIWKIIAEAT
jgi:hypothetical protein